jgi:hypothetical protein
MSYSVILPDGTEVRSESPIHIAKVSERTIVTDPERAAAEPWPWVVKVTPPGAETVTRRFGRRDQAEYFASHVRAQAAWDEL